MKRTYIILTALTLLAAFTAGCRRVDDSQSGDPIEGGRTIGVAAGISFNPTSPLGKATPSTTDAAGVFEPGDAIGLYLKSSVTDYVAANSNVLYTATERQVPPETEGGEATTVLEFASANPMKYYSYDKHIVTGYYPYQAVAPAFDAAKELKFTVLADQTGAQATEPQLTNYTLSDLMWAQKVDQQPQPKNTTEKIQMTFNHKLTNVIIVVKNQGDIAFVGDAPVVWIANTNRASLLNLEDGTVSANAVTTDFGDIKMERITPYESGITKEVQYRAIAVPQTIAQGKVILSISSGGVLYNVSATQQVVYQSGKQQKINVLNTGVGIRMSGCEIQDWGSVKDVNGGAIGGDGVNPCKLNFIIAGGVADAMALITNVNLVISEKTYPSTGVTYNSTTKILTVSYDQGTDWGAELQGYELLNATTTVAKATDLQWTILGDPSDANYTKVVGGIALEADFDYITQPANSYITYPGKAILFDARKKAVSINGAATNIVDADVPSTDITPASVSVVWQTAANHGTTAGAENMIIQSVAYNATTGVCTVFPHATGTGNALVAAYDADGTTILWSWHIWVTDGEVQGNVSPGNEANGAGKNFMDRNLGALAATTVQPDAPDAFKYFGLLWQWGRKEPFTGQGLGEKANTYTKIYKADATEIPAGTLGGFTYNKGAAATMMDCIQNPTNYYSANNVPKGDFGLISDNPDTWSDNPAAKSIYDPCPYGYRVPISESWTGFPVKTWADGTINEGQLWQSTWWPAAGNRSTNSAALVNTAYGAHYWSSSRHSSVAYDSYYLGFACDGTARPRNNLGRSYGFSLRCVQE